MNRSPTNRIQSGVVSLVFTKVLDELQLGLVGEDEETRAVTDRSYWEERATKKTLAMTDSLFSALKELDKDLDLKYNKFYIGVAENGQPNNFVVFRPKKEFLRVEIWLEKTDELDGRLEQAGLDVMDYDRKWGKYRIRLAHEDLRKHEQLLRDLLRQSYQKSEA